MGCSGQKAQRNLDKFRFCKFCIGAYGPYGPICPHFHPENDAPDLPDAPSPDATQTAPVLSEDEEVPDDEADFRVT